ncbi:hypothetical protein HK101_010318 [Irineochytrium annulatum]|nr:hypothetical protein HK101_010318 [Irineochytrium annulatum]
MHAKMIAPLLEWFTKSADTVSIKDVVAGAGETFILVFPRWDLVAVFFSVFTLTYLYIEGKSNYFKGAMLLLAYSLLMVAFFYAPPGLSSDTF